MDIKGFKSRDGSKHQYDYEALANKPKNGTGTVKSVNGVEPDENGDVKITIPDSSENADLTGYATEQYVNDYAQPKGDYLTEVPSGYATENYVKNQIAQAQLEVGNVDLSDYAKKDELPTAINTALARAKESGEFDGQDGKSAYQIAIENGFEGSEKEWLESLKGEQDEPGGNGSESTSFLSGLKYYALGDSIVDNQGTTELPETFGSSGYTIDMQGNDITDITVRGYIQEIEQKYGLVCTNYGKGGHTIVKDYPTLSALDYSDVVLVTIAYGVNDARTGIPLGTLNSTDITTFAGAMNMLLKKIYTDNPECRVIILTPLQRLFVTNFGISTPNVNGNYLIEYVDMCIKIAGKRSTNVIDMYRKSGLNQTNLYYYSVEGVHPLNNGYKRMAALVLAEMEKITSVEYEPFGTMTNVGESEDPEPVTGDIVGADLSWTRGYVNADGGISGVAAAAPSWTSEYINTNGATVITITDKNAISLRWAEFDTNENFISRNIGDGYANHSLTGPLGSSTTKVRITVTLHDSIEDTSDGAKAAGVRINFV